ncbi:Ig-like domain-containing protein [Chloroflexota bacterium]
MKDKILLLATTLVIFCFFLGCVPGLSGEQTDDFVAKCITVGASVQTAGFDMDLSLTMEQTGGDNPYSYTVVGGGTGVANMSSREMRASMDVTTRNPEADSPTYYSRKTYVTGEWLYYMLPDPLSPIYFEKWSKALLTEYIWVQENQFEQQMAFLRTATAISYSGIESVDGIPCYVFDIGPDTSALLNTLGWCEWKLPFDLRFRTLSTLDNLIKEESVTMWIAQDSSLPVKSTVHVTMSVSSGDLGYDPLLYDFTRTVAVDMTVRLHSYNLPVSFEPLPEKAENAIEFSPIPTPTPPPTPTPSVYLTTIEISPPSPNSIAIGETIQFTATGTYSDGSTEDITSRVKWSSVNDHATISPTGLATGVSAGATYIWANMSFIGVNVYLDVSE